MRRCIHWEENLKSCKSSLASEGMLLSAYLGHRDREVDVKTEERDTKFNAILSSIPRNLHLQTVCDVKPQQSEIGKGQLINQLNKSFIVHLL